MIRREFFFWITLIAASNAMIRHVFNAFRVMDPINAITTAFNVSVIVWVALIWPLVMLWQRPEQPTQECPIDRVDLAIGAGALLISVLPIEFIGWLAVLAIGLAIWLRGAGDIQMEKAGVLLVGVTIPQFWAKIIFTFMSNYILTWDAALVSQFTGTARRGNLVAMPNGEGMLEIAGACSSFGNTSLALVGWLLALIYYRQRQSLRLFLYSLLTVGLIILSNTIRIALIGFFPQYYHFLHDGLGSTVIGWFYVVIVFGVSSYAMQTERRPQQPVVA